MELVEGKFYYHRENGKKIVIEKILHRKTLLLKYISPDYPTFKFKIFDADEFELNFIDSKIYILQYDLEKAKRNYKSALKRVKEMKDWASEEANKIQTLTREIEQSEKNSKLN